MTRWNIGQYRRELVRLCFGGAAAILAPSFPPADLGAQGISALTIAVVAADDAVSKATLRGVDLGFREAAHAASLFRKKIRRIDAPDCSKVKDAQVVIFAGDAASASDIAAACAAAGVVFLNASASADALRAQCSPFVFHVAASDAMRRRVAAGGAEGTTTEMWDASLERFGAGQLNDRFRETGGEMGSAEWAGWMSVKIAWEAYLRRPEGTASAIAEWLARDATHFDGHKGAPLSFRAWDHQLRQPLYIVDKGGRITEVPSLSRSDMPVRELLDSLDEPPGQTRCA